jgi:serine/threonine-protein kinase
VDRVGHILVDTYRIDRLIAEGGMGAVYEASHLRIPKRFAVKFLHLSLLDNTIALMRFRREAEVVATLDHPHIVNLFDYNITEDGVPYTVLEFLDGEHLGARVSRGKLGIDEALQIGRAVAGALTAAHARGVIHRDLKPENIILCGAGKVKVVDFGIAKLRGSPELTAFNSILGTISYMAPEQLMAGTVDGRTDLYALAVMIYEMLSGQMIFGGSDVISELAEKVLKYEPGPIEGVAPAVSAVLKKAMSKAATDRHATVDEFMRALSAAAAPVQPPTARHVIGTGPHAPSPVAKVAPLVASASAAGSLDTHADPPTGKTLMPPDEALSELPGEATSISLPPRPPPPLDLEPVPTRIESVGSQPLPAEVTRITDSTSPELEPLTGEHVPPATRITMYPRPPDGLRFGVVTRIGESPFLRELFSSRRGVIVGAVVGVLVATVISLLLR